MNDETAAEVEAIVREHRENAAHINLEVLRLWIRGKGKPLSWNTLMSLIGTLASDIKDGLHIISFLGSCNCTRDFK